LRIAMEHQRKQLLRFSSVLDGKLDVIAEQFNVSRYHVHVICLLQRKPKTSAAYWQRRGQINHQLGSQCHAVFEIINGGEQASYLFTTQYHRQNAWLMHRMHLGQQLGVTER